MISIENSIVRGLLFNEEYSRKVFPFLSEEYFESGHRTIFTTYKTLFDKYNKQPTLEAIAIHLQKSKLSESEFADIFSIVEEVVEYNKTNEHPDTEWLVDETESFCQDVAMYNALNESIQIAEGNNKQLDKSAIPDILNNALAISFDTSIGMDFFDDAERRFDLYTAEDNRIKFPLDALNTLSNGGLKKKSLSCILAGTNVGKSSLMCYLAGEFLKQGKNVLYISLEMAEELIHERVEANLLDVTTDGIKQLTKEQYLKGIKGIKGKTNGRFVAKEYPTSSGHVGHFRHLLKELKQKKKFKPDVVMVDYINICASSRYKSLSGVNSYSYVKAIAEELRGLAVEFDVPILTATQTNRDGSKESNPDMTSTSECLTLDTEVITNKGKKLLKDVHVGDKLLGSDGFVTVSQVHHPKTKKVYKIKTKSGKVVRCSEDHVFPTKDGRKSIKSGLVVGDNINTVDI